MTTQNAIRSTSSRSDLIVAPVVEPGGAGGFMAGHLLGDLELAAVLQIGGDAGGAEAVGADWPGAGECDPSAGHGAG
jgi:hypothetical protein